LFENFQICPGRTFEFFRIPQDEHPGCAAVRMNLPCHHEAIPPVVADTADNHEFLIPDAHLF